MTRLVVAVVVAALAVVGLAPVAAAQDVQEDAGGTADGFEDVTGGVHKPAIDALAEQGLFDGTECGEDMFCPGDEMKRWTMAVWLVRVLDEAEPPAATESSFADVDFERWYLPHIERLAELEITQGCLVDPLRFCPDRSVNRAEMATFLERAFDLEAADPAGFADTAGNFHEANIDALAAARITAGCQSDPPRYCPDQPVTRAEMATFLARALGLVEKPAPIEISDPVEEPPPLPGEGIRVTAARADWQSGYFQAELYKLLLEELGYDVSDPAEAELGPQNAYTAMALGDVDYWPNSWYPAHLAWHAAQLPDGSLVGDHLEIVGEQMLGGGLQGFLVDKSFADAYGVYTMDELNRNAEALAAFDATDPVPGNGKADVFGCPTTWTCDNVITNMIAFSGWDNIAQVTDFYDDMFDRAVANIGTGVPTVIFTWAPSAYIARLPPGGDVYWMGMENILDDSNPADQPHGHDHNQRGFDGTGGYAPISADQCPSAADQPSGRCKIGWFAPDIQVTANKDFLDANPAARALFEAVKLSVVEVSQNNLAVSGGSSPAVQAVMWVAENRALVDQWLTAVLGRPPVEPAVEPDAPTDDPATDDAATDQPALADLVACRPRGTPYTTAGFPLPRDAAPSIGTMRVAVLFMDFPDVRASYTTQDEAALGLPYAEAYLEAASYGRLDVEFVPRHGWLRAERSFEDYLQQYAIGESRVAPSAEAIRLADPSFDFTGIHAVMTVLPSSRFQAGNHTFGLERTDEKAIRLMAEVNTAPLDEPRDPSPWGPVAAHELAHSLGLSDLYPYDASRHEQPEAPKGRIWVHSEFGLMGLNTAFVAHPEDRRIEITGRRPSGRQLTGHAFRLEAAEMLAWSRWQLGWLDASQVLCLSGDRSRVMLSPVAAPGDAAVMAAVPLSSTEVLVVEVRVKVGYDAEEERTLPDGAVIMVPRLAVEGVLVYTVDASLGSGQLPLVIAGDAGNGQVDDYPILTRGDQVVVRGYTVTFVSDRGGYIVAIFKIAS
ncbi:MAG: hypothetical protein F4Z00_04025 [Acidimicrobiaceae bacterium]|nr:hypothetical protein [Acidimicrobiaceae bacterium]MDE0515179.1 hypothetical protein [Acidimicrobiaceae bacterium]MDE0657983.1 hypothetical protein [Acidimicrobiaceae bacterium]MXZ64700.1 hypothetical protein [Acidimicrobiaceae bacterium]MYF41684.1 hypothetical protein [Acidimicrobiaceae bacterium]